MDETIGHARRAASVDGLKLRASTALVLLLASLGATRAVATETIFRCDDGHGGVLYADVPCAGGTRLDLTPGKADPRAIERLDRELVAFHERQAAREARARERTLAAREERLAEREAMLVAALGSYADAPTTYYPAYAWPVAPFRHHALHDDRGAQREFRRHKSKSESFVPLRPALALPFVPWGPGSEHRSRRHGDSRPYGSEAYAAHKRPFMSPRAVTGFPSPSSHR